MIINRAYKTELKLNNKEISSCHKHAGVARFAWNWGLARRIEEYRGTGTSSNSIEQNRELNALKKIEFPWMYDVSKCAPQEALRDLDKAYANFFNERTKYPKFKKKNKSKNSFRLTGRFKIFDNSIQLPRLGKLRLKEHGYIPINTHVLSVTISEKAGHWYVSVSVEEDITVPENQGETVGVDLGIKTMAYVSDGTTFNAPKPLKQYERKLKRANQHLSRTKKGSENRKKAVQEVQKIHKKISDIRIDALHKVTTHLTKTKSVIVLEDLNVSGMMKNHCLAKAISDIGLYEFRRQIEYKSQRYGSTVTFADRFYPSSKRCSSCGHIKQDLTLSDRTYVCNNCGNTIDRDYNASLNLQQVAVSSPDTITPLREESSGLCETIFNDSGNEYQMPEKVFK